MKRFITQTLTLATALLLAGSAVADSGKGSLTPAAREVVDHLVAIQESLAGDEMGHVGHHASAIATAIGEHKIHGLPKDASKQAKAVADAKDIKAAREAFKKLNESFVAYLKDHPDQDKALRVAYCPMAKASWVQTGSEINNPYFGKSMLTCGTFKD